MKGLGDPRQPVPFTIVVLLGFVVARFIAVAAHEVLGHGLSAQVLGGSFYGVYISPGSGFTLLFLPFDSPPIAQAFVAMAGILAAVLIGMAVFAAYPRARTVVGRLFVLLLLQGLLVYSFIYLALGAIPGTGGDSEAAVAELGAGHLTASFVVLGIAWALGSAYVISAECVRLVAPNAPLKRQFVYLGLFWFTPLAAGFVPALAVTTGSLLLYFVLFLAVGGAIFAFSALLASRTRVTAPTPILARPDGRVLPIIIAMALVVPIWVGVFGLSDADAHGILIQQPPLGAERTLFDSEAIDMQLDLAASRNVSLTFRMKGVAPAGASPLEAQAFATFERRPDWTFWTEQARVLAAAGTNVSNWTVITHALDDNRIVWSGNQEFVNGRLVDLGITDPADRTRLVNETMNGTKTYVELIVYDPFRANRLPISCDTCFLDEVNLTWAGGAPEPFRVVYIKSSGGTTAPLMGFDAASGRHFARYRNLAPADAPSVYTILLEVL